MGIRALHILIAFLFFVSCVGGQDEENESLLPEEPTQLMNLLDNGNCEKWLSDMPEDYLSGWSLKGHKGTVFKESNLVYEGIHSAKLHSYKSGITAFISQKINVNSGHRIRIRFHFFLEEYSGTAPRMYCYFRESGFKNISNAVLMGMYDEKTLDIIRGGGYGLKNFPVCEGEWQLFDYTIQVPAIAHYFVFEIHSYFGAILYIDDCYVVDVDM